MNKVFLIGRLTADPEVRATENTTVARFSMAVDRRFKKDEADFIRCVAFGKTAEFAEKYMRKGVKYGICGRIQTGSYLDRETGKKVYTTDVIVEETYFVESKGKEGSTPAETQQGCDGFMHIPDDVDSELPWN